MGAFIGDLTVDPRQIKNSKSAVALPDDAREVLVGAMTEAALEKYPFMSMAASNGLVVTGGDIGADISQWDAYGKTSAAEVAVAASDAMRPEDRRKVARMATTLPTIAKVVALDMRERAALESGRLSGGVQSFVRRMVHECYLAIEEMFIKGSNAVVGTNTIYGVSNLPSDRRSTQTGANWGASGTTGSTVEANVIAAMDTLLAENISDNVAIFCGHTAFNGLRRAYSQGDTATSVGSHIGKMAGVMGYPVWASQLPATAVAYVEMAPESVDLHMVDGMNVMMYEEGNGTVKLCVYTFAVPRVKSWSDRKSVVYQTV